MFNKATSTIRSIFHTVAKRVHIINPLLLVLSIFPLASCLGPGDCRETTSGTQPVRFIYHWEDGITNKPEDAMRLNLFAADGGSDYGREDLLSDDVIIRLPQGRTYYGTTYSYFDSENVFFINETDPETIEAYARPITRATYTRAFPDESTVMEPIMLYTDLVPDVTVEASDETQIVNLYPVDVVRTYTFEVLDVRGAGGITATRGALSGISSSYFLMTQTLSGTVSTVMFDGDPDGDTDMITGSFRIFGLAGDSQSFSIEILYPSETSGYVLLTWDVSDQLTDGRTHISVRARIEIIPESNTGAGFDTIVTDWNDVVVPIEM